MHSRLPGRLHVACLRPSLHLLTWHRSSNKSRVMPPAQLNLKVRLGAGSAGICTLVLLLFSTKAFYRGKNCGLFVSFSSVVLLQMHWSVWNGQVMPCHRPCVKAVLNWKRTRAFSRAQQAPLFLN